MIHWDNTLYTIRWISRTCSESSGAQKPPQSLGSLRDTSQHSWRHRGQGRPLAWENWSRQTISVCRRWWQLCSFTRPSTQCPVSHGHWEPPLTRFDRMAAFLLPLAFPVLISAPPLSLPLSLPPHHPVLCLRGWDVWPSHSSLIASCINWLLAILPTHLLDSVRVRLKIFPYGKKTGRLFQRTNRQNERLKMWSNLYRCASQCFWCALRTERNKVVFLFERRVYSNVLQNTMPQDSNSCSLSLS